MLKKIKYNNKPLIGEITIPADKSISHRAIMFSSIAEGKSLITNFSNGADCITTLNLFKSLGVNIQYKDATTVKIESKGLLTPNNNHTYYCGNSGTTMRLVSGILAGQNFNSTLTGDESLSKRPMKRVIEPLMLMGANINSTDNHAPLSIKGSKLHGIEYNSELSSAQVKSCVLLAGLNANGKTIYTEPYTSRNHTERLFKYLEADIQTLDRKIVLSPSRLKAKDIQISGDISSAAFFIVAGLIVKDSNITIKNVGLNNTRSGIIDIVIRMNGNIEIINKRVISGEDVGDIKIKYTENLRSCIIEGADIPRLIDELPVIAVLASQAKGTTIIKNAEDLRNKEADRIKCVVKELTKLGINITETSDGFIIIGNGNKYLAEKESPEESLECYHDHRLAMSFYIAGLICKHEIGINGFEWTNISFPNFEELIFTLFKV